MSKFMTTTPENITRARSIKRRVRALEAKWNEAQARIDRWKDDQLGREIVRSEDLRQQAIEAKLGYRPNPNLID